MSVDHPDLKVSEFQGRHINLQKDTLTQMAALVRGWIGKRLRYADLCCR